MALKIPVHSVHLVAMHQSTLSTEGVSESK